MRAKRSAERAEWPESLSKLPAGLGLGRGSQRETALRHAQQNSLGAQPPGNGGSARKKRALGGRIVTAEISKIAIGDLRAGAPAPSAIHNGMHFRTRCRAAQVQVRERHAHATKSLL